MSRENVEIARQACEAAWRRPKPDYDTLRVVAHPDAEMFTVQSLVEGGGYRGAEGFRRWLMSWREMFGEDWEATVENAAEVDDDRVLITGRVKMRGLQGGVPVDQRFWAVMDLRNGKVSRAQIYTERAAALEAAGLRE